MPSPHSLQSSSLEHQHLQLDVSSAPGCQQPLPQKAFLQTPGTAHSGQQSMLDSNLSRVFWNPLTGEAPERPAFISLSSVLKWRGGREGEMEREKRGRGRDTIFIFRLPSSLRADSVLLLNPELVTLSRNPINHSFPKEGITKPCSHKILSHVLVSPRMRTFSLGRKAKPWKVNNYLGRLRGAPGSRAYSTFQMPPPWECRGRGRQVETPGCWSHP
jgi:hypothetical protein